MLGFAGKYEATRGLFLSRKLLILLSVLLLLSAALAGAQESDPEDTPFTPQSRTNQRSLGDQWMKICPGTPLKNDPVFT